MTEARREVAGRLRQQSGWCAKLGSPLYRHLLEEAAADVEAEGPTWALLRDRAGDPAASALALRFMGAVHRLVLEGRAPELARHYPSAGGNTSDPAMAWGVFRRTLEEHAAALRDLVCEPVQTNEVGRAAALAGGFLTVARETRLPLAILEPGTSAGLNLRWDHFRYHARGGGWGDVHSPVQLRDMFPERMPPFDVAAEVIERGGCDAAPVDPCSEVGRRTLLAYVWPDQSERIALLTGALEVAHRVPAAIERADAGEWLARELTRVRAGMATVVFHSILAQYLGREGRERFLGAIAEAGARATPAAPLAWLRMEPGGHQAARWLRMEPIAPAEESTEVRLTTWPGGEDRLLATAGSHGRPVRWLADGPPTRVS
jgi:hypothetical protein